MNLHVVSWLQEVAMEIHFFSYAIKLSLRTLSIMSLDVLDRRKIPP
jgi:hypothetical protein